MNQNKANLSLTFSWLSLELKYDVKEADKRQTDGAVLDMY